MVNPNLMSRSILPAFSCISKESLTLLFLWLYLNYTPCQIEIKLFFCFNLFKTSNWCWSIIHLSSLGEIQEFYENLSWYKHPEEFYCGAVCLELFTMVFSSGKMFTFISDLVFNSCWSWWKNETLQTFWT